MGNEEGKHVISVDAINNFASLAKWAWGLLIGAFLFGAAANWQLMTISFENQIRDGKIEVLEQQSVKYWHTLMITDLTLETHATNRFTLLSEKELRQLVDDIYCRYSK